MNKIFVICITFLVLALSTSIPLSAEDTGSPSVYTNEDLGKYTHASKEPSGSPQKEDTNTGPDLSPVEREIQDHWDPAYEMPTDSLSTRHREEMKKRTWCIRGNSLRNNIEVAESDFKAAKKYYDRVERDNSVIMISSCKLNAAKSRMESAKHRLERARKKLADLENEAHSQWVPPGWVRCQFDY